MSEYCITNWEIGHTEPKVSYIPNIVRFISYYPYVPTTDLIDRFKAVRLVLGLTQERLAKILEVDECSIASWEKREHRPVKKSLEIIRSFLNFTGYWDDMLNDQISDNRHD